MDNDQVCVLMVGEGESEVSLAGVTNIDEAEEWRKADRTHRGFEIFRFGKILDNHLSFVDDDRIVIESFVAADGCDPVQVSVQGGDEWDRQKATELIKAALQMYHALNDAIDHLALVDPNWDHLEHLERAQAAACGAVLQRDRMKRGK